MNPISTMGQMFAPLAPGMCRISINGQIAVKTSTGYKTYNMKNNKLVNCSNFAFDIGSDFFFAVPTNNAKRGDIILVHGKPCVVINATPDELKILNFETTVLETILPERHMFMGNMYLYRKIFSIFGNTIGKDGNGMKSMMKFMVMQSLMSAAMGGTGTTPGIPSSIPASNANANVNPMAAMMPMFLVSMLSNNSDMFDGMFSDMDFAPDFIIGDESDDENEEE